MSDAPLFIFPGNRSMPRLPVAKRLRPVDRRGPMAPGSENESVLFSWIGGRWTCAGYVDLETACRMVVAGEA